MQLAFRSFGRLVQTSEVAPTTLPVPEGTDGVKILNRIVLRKEAFDTLVESLILNDQAKMKQIFSKVHDHRTHKPAVKNLASISEILISKKNG